MRKAYRIARGILAGSTLTVGLLVVGWHILAFQIAHVDRKRLAVTIAAENARVAARREVENRLGGDA